MPPTAKPTDAEQALDRLRHALNPLPGTEPPAFRDEDVATLVRLCASQQSRLAKLETRAQALADDETHQLVLLAAGVLARLDPATTEPKTGARLVAALARATLDAIREDVARRQQ